MASRPGLTEESFLRHLFSPKKNPLPTGIRKRPIAFTPGRTKARVAAYNRMSGASQETLRRAGLRDDYLKGNATLADAKKALRRVAVDLGIAKPTAGQPRRVTSHLNTLAGDVAVHVSRTLARGGTLVAKKFFSRVKHMPESMMRDVLTWDAARIKAYASHQQDEPDYMVIIDGKPFNPLWYY